MNENVNLSCALLHPDVKWKHLKWTTIIHRVNKLQCRIAKAVKQNKFGKAKALMHLLVKSYNAKLLAVYRVSQINKGKSTAGVDGNIWETDKLKENAVKNLSITGYNPKPLRRIYIPKKNGKKRPLSIPTMKDRAMQTLFALALEPWAETTADSNSYGFRRKRSCQDAAANCFLSLCRKASAQWVFEADIKACFDEINHEWLLKNIPIRKTILKKWLKAGFIENKWQYKTIKGTPQGGTISPILMNMVLDEMEKELKSKFPKWKSLKVNFTRYADDFIITARDKQTIENGIIPLVNNFLKERGLVLSPEKSKITHISKGFNFLSYNFRKYKTKLIIKPSKQSVQEFKDKIKRIFKNFRGVPAHALIRKLNPVIRGWSNYHKGFCAKRTFNRLSTTIYNTLKRWTKNEHANQNIWWIFHRYFKGNHFSDTCKKKKESRTHRLYKIAQVPIKYHIKIKANANPYLKEFDKYFYGRQKDRFKLATNCKQITSFEYNKNKYN
jgi:RNA-directed DNA polymerase